MQSGDDAARGLGALSSPSRTRSPEPQVVGEALAIDVHTATPPQGAVESRATLTPMADSRAETPPRAADAQGASAGGIRATTSPTVIDIDPISSVPSGAEDLVTASNRPGARRFGNIWRAGTSTFVFKPEVATTLN
jgi:hypothetical protein